MDKSLLSHAAELMLTGVSNRHTHRSYERAVSDFIAWINASDLESFSRVAVLKYLKYMTDKGASVSSVNQNLSAIKRLAHEATDNNMLDEVTMQSIHRVKKHKVRGKQVGTWLSKEQAQQMIDAPNRDTLKGARDRAILAVLIGCGLRRGELVSLNVDHIQLRKGRWVIANLMGKHTSIRTVPMAKWVKQAIDLWLEKSGITDGVLFPPMRRGGHILSGRMTEQGVWEIVLGYSVVDDITPHDLRRTFAKLAHASGSPIEQIQKSLGHRTVATTERYLNVDLDLDNSPSDSIVMSL